MRAPVADLDHTPKTQSTVLFPIAPILFSAF